MRESFRVEFATAGHAKNYRPTKSAHWRKRLVASVDINLKVARDPPIAIVSPLAMLRTATAFRPGNFSVDAGDVHSLCG